MYKNIMSVYISYNIYISWAYTFSAYNHEKLWTENISKNEYFWQFDLGLWESLKFMTLGFS